MCLWLHDEVCNMSVCLVYNVSVINIIAKQLQLRYEALIIIIIIIIIIRVSSSSIYLPQIKTFIIITEYI